MTVERVVSHLKAAKYASVIISVPSKPQNTDTHNKLHSVDLEILFILFQPQNINGERSIAPNKCSMNTIFIAGNS
jgi:hypothetical protein